MKIIDKVVEIENIGRENIGIKNDGLLNEDDKKVIIKIHCPSTYGFNDSCIDKIRNATKCKMCFNREC